MNEHVLPCWHTKPGSCIAGRESNGCRGETCRIQALHHDSTEAGGWFKTERTRRLATLDFPVITAIGEICSTGRLATREKRVADDEAAGIPVLWTPVDICCW